MEKFILWKQDVTMGSGQKSYHEFVPVSSIIDYLSMV